MKSTADSAVKWVNVYLVQKMVLIKAIVFHNSHRQATAFMIIIVSTQDYNVARYIIPRLTW